MKVLIDTNVYLSYILAPERQGVVTAVVSACLSLDKIDLLVPPEQIAGFAEKAATKKYFRSRTPYAVIDPFVAQLRLLSELQPLLEEDVASYSRDPKDDYLIICCVAYEVEYLVTGDQELLVLHQIGQTQIVTPAQFLNILRSDNHFA